MLKHLRTGGTFRSPLAKILYCSVLPYRGASPAHQSNFVRRHGGAMSLMRRKSRTAASWNGSWSLTGWLGMFRRSLRPDLAGYDRGNGGMMGRQGLGVSLKSEHLGARESRETKREGPRNMCHERIPHLPRSCSTTGWEFIHLKQASRRKKKTKKLQ
jgi:hypothetical protein